MLFVCSVLTQYVNKRVCLQNVGVGMEIRALVLDISMLVLELG